MNLYASICIYIHTHTYTHRTAAASPPRATSPTLSEAYLSFSPTAASKVRVPKTASSQGISGLDHERSAASVASRRGRASAMRDYTRPGVNIL